MIKKIFGLLIVLLLVASMAVGCGGGTSDAEETEQVAEVEEKAEVTEAAEETKEEATEEAATEESAENVEEASTEASEATDLGNPTGEVLNTAYGDIQVLAVNRDNEKSIVVKLAIKNTTSEVVKIEPGCLFVENKEKAEGEKDFMWNLMTTNAPFLSEVRLVPGGMMVGEIGFKATPDQAKVLLINKDFNFFEKEVRDRIDLTGEPAALAITAEPDYSTFESATQSTIGTAIPVIPGEDEVTVKSWEKIENSTLEPPLEGFCNIRVDYNFNNLKDEEMHGHEINIAVLDYATGMLLQQGTFPLLDDELWIFDVEAKSNMDGFQCFEVTEGGQYAIVMNLPFKEDYTVVPLS